MKHIPLGISTFLLTANMAIAGGCDALLKHGMANITITKSASSSIATKYFNHCHKDFSSMNDDVLATISVEVIGYGDGDARYSRNKASQDLTNWCKTNKENAEGNKELYEESRQLYEGAYDAFEKCQELTALGLQTEVDITPDNQAITVGLRWTGPGSIELYNRQASTKGFVCETFTSSGAQADDNSPIRISTSAVNVSCQRDDPVLETRPSGEYLVSPWGRVVVQTEVGPIPFYFAPEDTPTLPTAEAIKLRARVKELDTQIQTLNQELTASVTAFDLEECPDGWQEYKPAYGRVVRGLDRSGEKIDPELDRKPGDIQGDALQTHDHRFKYHNAGTTGHRDHDNMEFPTPTGNREVVAQAGVGRYDTETRMKNVALLYCRKS